MRQVERNGRNGGSLFETVRLFPVYADSLAIYAKRFVCPEVVIANSYLVISTVRFLSRSAMFATRRVIRGCNTTVYALHSIFDLNEDNENEEKFFKNLPLLANPVYSKC